MACGLGGGVGGQGGGGSGQCASLCSRACEGLDGDDSEDILSNSDPTLTPRTLSVLTMGESDCGDLLYRLCLQPRYADLPPTQQELLFGHAGVGMAGPRRLLGDEDAGREGGGEGGFHTPLAHTTEEEEVNIRWVVEIGSSSHKSFSMLGDLWNFTFMKARSGPGYGFSFYLTLLNPHPRGRTCMQLTVSIANDLMPPHVMRNLPLLVFDESQPTKRGWREFLDEEVVNKYAHGVQARVKIAVRVVGTKMCWLDDGGAFCGSGGGGGDGDDGDDGFATTGRA